jgi:hypothetical protein
MYPEGTLVQVIGNTNNHWFEVGEFITVTKACAYNFRGRAASGDERATRYHMGGGPRVLWREVIPAQPLEQLLKECLE